MGSAIVAVIARFASGCVTSKQAERDTTPIEQASEQPDLLSVKPAAKRPRGTLVQLVAPGTRGSST